MAINQWYMIGSFVIYNPKTRKRYYRKSLFKVRDSHDVIGFKQPGKRMRKYK